MNCKVIINPKAGKGLASKIWKKVESVFVASSWKTTLCLTNDIDLHNEYDACIVVGGDGTYHRAVNTLIHNQIKIPLGFIPAGSGNALLTDLECLTPIDAARRIVSGQRRCIDIMEITTADETIYGISVMGWGMFSSANQNAERWRWLGGMRYNIGALWDIIFKKTYPARLVLDNDLDTGDFIAVYVCNTIHTGKRMRVAPKAKINDGLLDLVTIKNGSRLTLLKSFNDFLVGQYLQHKLVSYRQVAGFELHTDFNQILAVDGEMVGRSPFSIRVLPEALELMI